MKLQRLKLACAILLASAIGVPAFADPINGTLYFTTYNGGVNVHRTNYSFDGTTFTMSAPVGIGSTVGADGLAGNPQNPDLLLVGGQGPRINTISRTTGAATVYGSPVSVYHIAVTDATTVYGSGIPGAMARHTINPDGSIGVGTTIAVSGSNLTISTLIPTPSGFFYTAGGTSGFGNFGTLTFGPANTATTTALGFFDAAHGGAYDPFTNSILLMGDSHITQLDLLGNVLADLVFPGQNFDQGTVDGLGHLFAASNTGHLTFIDYSATGRINSGAFVSTQFLANFLDDVAPLVGSGSTGPPPGRVPEPATLALLGLGLMAIGVRRMRAKKRV